MNNTSRLEVGKVLAFLVICVFLFLYHRSVIINIELEAQTSVDEAQDELYWMRQITSGKSETCGRFEFPRDMSNYVAGTSKQKVVDLSVESLRKAYSDGRWLVNAANCKSELDLKMMRELCRGDPFRAGLYFYDRALANCQPTPIVPSKN